MTEMKASHAMNRNVISFGKEIYCNVLAETMLMGRFGSIPITSHNKQLIGVVSEYDLMNALKEGMDLRETLAVEVMAKPVISIKEEMPIEEVINLLLSKHFIRVPVGRHRREVDRDHFSERYSWMLCQIRLWSAPSLQT